MFTTVCLLTMVLGVAPHDYFTIRVVDEDTGRGVPLVELQTINNIRHYTDSNGIVAFHEPGLVDREVYFHVKSHGYEFPKDGFGFRGKRLKVEPGETVTLKIKRLNIAERLYRVTGAGIYRDSVLVGEKVPLKEPLLNGQVFGSDSVVNAVFRGKVYWFWGDTNKPSYPLGNFHVPGATSLLPGKGSLDPEKGVDLSYFVSKDGFAKPTAQMPGPGPTWIGGLVVLRDKKWEERLFAAYARIKGNMQTYERGIVAFDDEKKEFVKKVQFDLKAPFYHHGHPFRHTDDGVEYVYFADPLPHVRIRATAEDLLDISKYQVYTCFKEGGTSEKQELDRDKKGRLRFAWRKNTPRMTHELQKRLLKDGKLEKGERVPSLRDIETGKDVTVHSGSVYWNDYRKRWVMIALQLFGSSSVLGEVWFAEADTPVGPWKYARRIVTHEKYSFYNPKQHPMFDKEGGRFIFFEGTYTHTFSGNPEATPRYDYNQIMYRLDLADERLNLPMSVYRGT